MHRSRVVLFLQFAQVLVRDAHADRRLDRHGPVRQFQLLRGRGHERAPRGEDGAVDPAHPAGQAAQDRQESRPVLASRPDDEPHGPAAAVLFLFF